MMTPTEEAPKDSTRSSIVFAGTPDFAACALAGLIDAGHQVLACYTQPDRPAGRGQKLLESPVKQLARQHQIPVEQPLNFHDEKSRDTLRSYKADFLIVAAYGLILPQAVLDIPKRCCLNIHASLLPRWRGAAPIQHAILAGDHETGISIMKMERGLDCGDILLLRKTAILADDTGSSLHDRLAQLGKESMLDCLANFDTLYRQRLPQDETLSSYANKIIKADALIDWCDSAEKNARKVRAFNSWPVAFSFLDGQPIRIWQAQAIKQSHSHPPGTIVSHEANSIHVACDGGLLAIEFLQMPGKRPLPSAELLNSRKDFFAVGKRFSHESN